MPLLCIVTSHPIQYMVPWFQELAKCGDIQIHVTFLREPTPEQQGIGFGKPFVWDVPLRDGYDNSALGVEEGIANLGFFLAKISRHLRDLRPDALMITGWNEPALAVTYLVAKLMGIPVIVRGESNDLRPRNRITRLLHRQFLKLVDAAVLIGSANGRFYKNNGVKPEQMFPGGYFVNTPHMIAMAELHAPKRGELRLNHGFAEEDFVFAFVGKHSAFKRPQLLIAAAALLKARGIVVKLLFAGSGDLTEILKEQAESLGVIVQFTGFLNQSEMWKAYLPADAFVLPSTFAETWGLVTNEAMLFGLPVIVSSQVGCAEDLVIDGKTGLTFNGGAEELADAMMKLYANRKWAANLGLAGRERIVRYFSAPVSTAGLLAAVRYVLARHAANGN